MDRLIQIIIDDCNDGAVSKVYQSSLLDVFKNNYNPEKETPKEAMKKWLDRTEGFLNIEWRHVDFDSNDPEGYYLFRSITPSTKNKNR